ncbi:MAG TPA: ATP-binding protein [Thermoanaerobaculia bacterium]|nr:ATP-binding protein [Thermoanaerobaculia bacterium]
MIESIQAELLSGGGESGALMRSVDWSATPVGPVSSWPQSLRTAVGILLDTSFGMAVAWGPQYTFFFNDSYRPILGSTKYPGAMGRRLNETFPEIWHIIGPMFDDVMRGKSFGWDNWRLPLDRHGFVEECFFTFSYSPIRDESGGVGGVLVTVSEITARVLGERRMRVLREIAARTAEAADEAEACAIAVCALGEEPWELPFAMIYLLDAEGTTARLVAHGGSIDSRNAPPVIALADDCIWPIAEAVRGGRAIRVDDLERLGIEHADEFGSSLIRQAMVLPVERHGDSRPAGVLVAGVSSRLRLDESYGDFLGLVSNQIATAVANVRAYREANERANALAELDRAKTVFFGNVSHEFRTPLTLLIGPIGDVLKRDTLTAADRDDLEIAQRNAHRLLKLVNTLLEFSRIEAGRINASYEATDLAAVTAELAGVFRSAIEKAGLTFTVRCLPAGEAVYVDRDMWEKIVLNLLSNALKFTFAGEIEVVIEPAGEEIELRVRDTGAGIPEAEIPNMFSRFHRVRGARSRSHEGSGIGLALVQELVRLHGGRVTVASTENVGTTFTVRIPRGSAHLPPDRVAAARPSASESAGPAAFLDEVEQWIPLDGRDRPERTPARPPWGRILVVEDNRDMRDYVRHLLQDQWTVETVDDGRAALERIRATKPDLVLADVMMPLMDGFELLRGIRQDESIRDLPVILLSDRAGEESKVEGLEAGADDYLVKPFSAGELIARVRSHITLAELRRESMQRERQLLRDLEIANRAKDEFLTTLSHELRTPMTATLGWAAMLKMGRSEHREWRQAADAIEQSTRAQAKLIDDILDISRISTGKMQLSMAPVSLEEVVEAAVSTVRQLAEAKAQVIVTRIQRLPGRVIGDADRLGQIVRNLLSNAVKFTPAEGQIRVDVDHAGDFIARVRISDSGEGISADFLPLVFDRFRQADSGLRRAHGGLGIGLSIVKDLTELHGGSVSAASDGRGKGATFTLTFPLAGGATLSAAAKRTADQATRLDGIQVLLVEDDDATRKMLHAVLGRFGADVSVARSAEEALSILAGRPLCVIVSDLAMPGQDGYDFIGNVRRTIDSASVRVPSIALTANARNEDRERALAAGFDSFIAKPVDIHRLAEEVRRLGTPLGDHPQNNRRIEH